MKKKNVRTCKIPRKLCLFPTCQQDDQEQQPGDGIHGQDRAFAHQHEHRHKLHRVGHENDMRIFAIHQKSARKRKLICYKMNHSWKQWKFQDFSVIQILREINFRESRSAKSAVYAISGALNFVDLVYSSLQKVQ